MDIYKKDWNKELRKLISSKGSDTSKIEITPFRDWGIIVMTFFCGLIIAIIFNIYMSIEINQDSFFVSEPTVIKPVVLNKEGLAKVLSMLAGKEALFEEVRTEKRVVVDPSI